MIDWLVSSIVPISVLTILLLASHKFLINYFGATGKYLSWLILPLSLLVYAMPSPWPENVIVSVAEIEVFTVVASNVKEPFLQHWLLAVWAGGAATILLYLCLSHYNYSKTLSSTLSATNETELGLPKGVKAYQSHEVYSPMLVGVFSPKIILPENFSQLFNDEQQSLILAHEICHYQRRDLIWNMLAISFVILFWFNPLIWLAYFRFRQDQELACDHVVIAKQTPQSRINYSRALVLVAETQPPLTFARLSFQSYGDKNNMLERIQNIKASKRLSVKAALAAVALTATSVAGISYAGQLGGHDYKEGEKVKVYPEIRIEPKYPVQAARDGVEGSVLLKFDIEEDGRTSNISVIAAKPENTFNKVAIAALSQWKYKVESKGRAKDMTVQLDFLMDSSSAKPENLVERIKVTKSH